MDTFIKYIFIYQYCIYTFFHLIKQKYLYQSRRIFLFLLTICLSSLTYLLKKCIPIISDTIPITLLWIVLSLLTSSPKISYIATVLSFGISYGIFAVSCSLVLLLLMPLYYQSEHFPYIFFMLAVGILGSLLITRLLKIRRFHNGMTFLYSVRFTNSGMFVCLFCMLILSYMHSNNTPSFKLAAILPLLLGVSIVILICWWQAQLTKSYRHKLQTLELESLRSELREKILLLDKLQKENTELSRLIHKDNKLIPAMENAVYEYLRSDFPDRADALSQGDLLIKELQNLSQNRHDTLSAFTSSGAQNFSTGIVSLDALLNYMNKRTASLNGNFTTHIFQPALSQLLDIISTDDLVHLLADLIENAIISISDCSSRDVKLQIYQHSNHPYIELSDTGIPFEISTLMNLGIKASTTHADTGGTGTGLMDIWEIKNKYRASLHVIEYETVSPFQKNVSILFDRKNQYLIYTWRHEQIISNIQRIDVHVLENNHTSHLI